MVIAELFATLGLLPDLKSWGEGSKLMGGLGKAALGLGAAIGGAFAVSKVKSWVDEITHAGDSAVKTSQRLGFTVEAVQELDYALGQSDASLSDLKVAMRKLAADGVKDPEKALADLADRFAGMEDGPEKVKLATEKLGRSGATLIPFLNSGSKGIAELRQEAHDLGVVINDETAVAFEKFGDDQDRLETAWKGVKTQLVSSLLPAMQKLVDKALEWIKTHQPEIANAIAFAAELAGKALSVLGTVMTGVIEVMNELAAHGEIVEAVLIAVGIVLGVLAVEAALAAAPFVILTAAAAALVLAFQDVWESITTGRGYTARAIDWIKAKWQSFVDRVMAFRVQAREWFRGIGDGIKEAFSAAIDFVKNKANEAWEEIKDTPIIGHAIRGGQFLANKLNGPSPFQSAVQQMLPNNTVVPPTTWASEAMAAASNNTLEVNAPITVNPAPGMDEAAIGDAVSNSLTGKFQQAYDAIRGGRR